MIKNFNETSSSGAPASSNPSFEAHGSPSTSHANLSEDLIIHYLSFLPPNEIATIKRTSRSYYNKANQALNYYRLINKNCKIKVGLKLLKFCSSGSSKVILVQNSQGQNQVYAWGRNYEGQLGLGYGQGVSKPTLIPFFKGATPPSQKKGSFNFLWQYKGYIAEAGQRLLSSLAVPYEEAVRIRNYIRLYLS